MDPQDQNSPSTTPISPVSADTVPSMASAPPTLPPTSTPPLASNTATAPTPFPVAQVPTYNAQHVQIEGNVAEVPQENIGLGQEAPVSTESSVQQAEAEAPIPGVIPVPADRLAAPAEVFPEAAEQTPALPLAPMPDIAGLPIAPPPSQDLPVPPQTEAGAGEQLPQPPAEGTESTAPPVDGESQKTPLEILEEILASANESPAEGAPAADGASSDIDKATADAQALAEEEAKQAAALAAETARYQQEAEQRITLAQQDIQDAAQQRVDVTQQLQSEGKQVGATVSTPEDQAFAIQQLEHDTLTQKSE